MILDINVIYGNVSVDYLVLDDLPDHEKNFNNIFPLNKPILNDYIKSINSPIVINTINIEIIRIVNNQYNTNKYMNHVNKTLMNINKYKIYSEIEENNLMPLLILSEENKFKININPFSSKIIYKFYCFNENFLYKDNNEYNLSITINNESFYLSNEDKDNIYTGTACILRYNQIRAINEGNNNVLIWAQIGEKFEHEYEIIIASQNSFQNVITAGKIYLFILDYQNIIEKKTRALSPYKFILYFEKPMSGKCNGYYHRALLKDLSNLDEYIFSPNSINSIYYELSSIRDQLPIVDDITSEELDLKYNNKKYPYLSLLLQQINGYLGVHFYMEYKYDLTNKNNQLVSFNFDNSVHSINYQLDKPNGNKYLLFQIMTCEKRNDFGVEFFQENTNITYFLNDNNNNQIL